MPTPSVLRIVNQACGAIGDFWGRDSQGQLLTESAIGPARMLLSGIAQILQVDYEEMACRESPKQGCLNLGTVLNLRRE